MVLSLSVATIDNKDYKPCYLLLLLLLLLIKRVNHNNLFLEEFAAFMDHDGLKSNQSIGNYN